MKMRSSENGRVVIYNRILKYLTRVHRAGDNCSFVLFRLKGGKICAWKGLFGILDFKQINV